MTVVPLNNGVRPTILAPGPDDMVLVLYEEGRRVAAYPAALFQQASAIAHDFARRTKRPVKLLPMTFHELLAFMNTTPAKFASSLSPETDEELRQIAIQTCFEALRYSNDEQVKDEAWATLVSLGMLTGKGGVSQ